MSYGHQIWTEGTAFGDTFIKCSSSGGGNVIIIWLRNFDKSLFLQLWIDYDYQIWKIATPVSEESFNRRELVQNSGEKSDRDLKSVASLAVLLLVVKILRTLLNQFLNKQRVRLASSPVLFLYNRSGFL